MTSTSLRAAMPIDVVSDVVCPWCFIGKRRLERALALSPDIPVHVRWRPYFLNPWIPRAGISREQYLVTKFGSVAAYEKIARKIAEAAAAEGLVYRVEAIARQPHTLDCHRLIRWAGENDGVGARSAQTELNHLPLEWGGRRAAPGGGQPHATLTPTLPLSEGGGTGLHERAARMKQRLMELYFAEGADLTERETLAQAAVDCGMDAQTVRERLASDADEREVTAEAMAASDAGVEGVPCFIFGAVLAVAGAQSPDYLANALGRAYAEFTRRLAAGEIGDVEARPY